MYCSAAKLQFPHTLTPKMVLKRCRSWLVSADHVNIDLWCVLALAVVWSRGFQGLPSNSCPFYASELLGEEKRKN